MPVDGKESIYKSYMNKMILASLGSSYSYRNLGITTLSPDYESTEKMINVCKNFHIKYNIIDPANRGSIGLNPFIYDDPNKIAITISAAFKLSALCNVALLTVTPATNTGSNLATVVIAPVLPTWNSTSFKRVNSSCAGNL